MDEEERVVRTTEWVEVRRKGGHKIDLPTTMPGHDAVDREATVESIGHQFTKQQQRWCTDPSREGVFKILQNLHILEGPPIAKAICLALGSLSRDNLENRRRSMAQLAVFLDIVGYLQSVKSSPIILLIQDPIFTQTDKRFLQSLGMTVLHADGTKSVVGEASQHFGPDTFVAEFYMHLTPDITAHLLRSEARLLLTTLHSRISSYQNSQVTRKKGEELKAAMESAYARYAFPFSHGQDFLAFEGLNFLGRIFEETDVE